MATFANQFLTGGTGNGRPIKIVATASPGTDIHTAGGVKDTIWLWVANSSATAVALTVQWGGTTDPDDAIVKGLSIPGNSKLLIAEGLPLAAALIVKAFAGTANVLIASGFAIRE